jgi:hypothetical protein
MGVSLGAEQSEEKKTDDITSASVTLYTSLYWFLRYFTPIPLL